MGQEDHCEADREGEAEFGATQKPSYLELCRPLSSTLVCEVAMDRFYPHRACSGSSQRLYPGTGVGAIE